MSGSPPSRNWLSRILLMVLVVAAPWPFGSVTPRAASILAASLFVLYLAFWGFQLLRRRSLVAPPSAIWIAVGLALAAFQILPLPSSLVGIAAPAVETAYAPLRTELEEGGWHPVSVEPFQTEWSLLQLLSLACAFHLANRLFRRSSDRDVFVAALTAVGVGLSLFAVYQKARFGTVLYGSVVVESATPFGPFVNHNHFAGYVGACVLVALGAALGWSRRQSSVALLLGGSAVLMGIGHLLSHSRGGLLAMAAGLLTLAWLSQRQQKQGGRILLAGGGLAVISFLLVFAPSGVFQRFATIGNPSSDDSIQFRMELWRDSLGLWAKSPIVGTGLGTYAAAIPPYRSGPDETRAEHAESDWIQLLCETGLAGFLIAVLLISSVLMAGMKEALTESSPKSRGIVHGAIAAAVALSVHGWVDFNFRIPSNALLFAVLLGLVAPEGAKLRWAERRLWSFGAALLLAIAGVSLAAFALRMGTSKDLNQKTNPLLAEPEEFTDLIQALATSRQSVPGNPETSYLLGRLYNEEAYGSREEVRYRELRLEQAGAAFRESLRMAPARGRYWFELAWTETNLGHDDDADRLFSLALALEPHWANLRANYALYLVSRGRVDEALDQLVAARDLDPGLASTDILNIIGPHLGGDDERLRLAVGEGPEADEARASFRKAE